MKERKKGTGTQEEDETGNPGNLKYTVALVAKMTAELRILHTAVGAVTQTFHSALCSLVSLPSHIFSSLLETIAFPKL